ncbi:MAG: hypothetical protein ACM31C_22330 [Acidobacteriota bacterium]
MSETVLHTPLPTGAPWLRRALAVSAVLHALAVAIVIVAAQPREDREEPELVDITIAPPAPKAEALPEELERAKAAEPAAQQEAAAAQEPPHEEPAAALVDAGVDAPVDAPAKKKPRPDAAVDAPGEEPMVAQADAGAGDAPTTVASASEVGSGSGLELGASSLVGSGSGAGAGSGSGSDAETDVAVEGAPTTAGTAANLLSYFPKGHVVTALLRLDRIRGTEWAAATEKLLRPLPDYQLLFGSKQASLGDKLDTLVISSPKPKDATATTLVAHTSMSRAQVRDFLANPDTPIAWSAARGGMLGKRSGKLLPSDKRVVLSPWKNWFLLAQPEDLGALTATARGRLDAIEARGKLPAWLDTLRDIEKESGDDKRGPALVVTLTSTRSRYQFPDVGVGVTSLPTPERASIAVELVKQGWLVRGNIKFGSEADAAEFVQALETAQQHVKDSRVLSALLRKQHVLDAVSGLSLARGGDRVSYATSISIADARAVLAAASTLIDDYFGKPQ